MAKSGQAPAATPIVLLYRLISGSVAMLPNWLLHALAWGLAFMLVRGVKLRRSLVRQNIAIALPTTSLAEQDRIYVESVYHFVLTLFETVAGGWMTLASTVTIEGDEELHQALAQGKGCLILCIHMGNWEALAASVSRGVAPTSVVVKKIGDGPVDAFVLWLRRRAGFQALQRKTKGDVYRRILEALKNNQIVGFVMDQYQPGAPEVDLFGVPARTNNGLATIWRRTGAPVVPITIRRDGPHQHHATILPPLELKVSADPQADVLEATQAFNHVIEEMILGNPEQYFWLHDRYKVGRQKAAPAPP